MDNIPKTFQYFMEAETAAAEVLDLKEEIISLHKRMNECREALSIIAKGDEQKAYMYEGGLLIRHTKEEMISKLRSNFKTLNEEIRARGDVLKRKVQLLQDIEQQNPMVGASLVPLDKAELQALGQLWGANQ